MVFFLTVPPVVPSDLQLKFLLLLLLRADFATFSSRHRRVHFLSVYANLECVTRSVELCCVELISSPQYA